MPTCQAGDGSTTCADPGDAGVGRRVACEPRVARLDDAATHKHLLSPCMQLTVHPRTSLILTFLVAVPLAPDISATEPIMPWSTCRALYSKLACCDSVGWQLFMGSVLHDLPAMPPYGRLG